MVKTQALEHELIISALSSHLEMRIRTFVYVLPKRAQNKNFWFNVRIK